MFMQDVVKVMESFGELHSKGIMTNRGWETLSSGIIYCYFPMLMRKKMAQKLSTAKMETEVTNLIWKY